jgi:branched-chain amino acid transport system substrate-binding protein
VLSVYWHPSVFPRNPFYEDAKKLWGEDVGVTWRTPMAYDATKVIIEGLKKFPASQIPTRERLQQILSDPEFKIEGATGTVQFLPSGERQGKQAFLVEVCPGKESGTGYDFVPLGTCSRK